MANTHGAYGNICATEAPQVMMDPSWQQVSTGDALKRQRTRERQKLTLYKLGLIEVISGLISVISGIVSLICVSTQTSSRTSLGYGYSHYSRHPTIPPLAYASQGIWCGIVIFASGVAGMKAKRNPSVYVFRTNSVLSIIAAAFAVLMALMSMILAISPIGPPIGLLVSVFHSILAAVGVLSAIICSFHSAVSCCTKCSENRPTRRVRYQRYQSPVTYTAQPSHRMVQLANGQYMMLVPCQPVQPIMSGVGPVPAMYQPYPASVPPPQAMTLPPPRATTPPPSCVVTPPVSQVIPPPQHIVMPPLTHMGMMPPPQMPIASALPPPQSVSPPPVQTEQMNGQPSQNVTATQENSEDPPPYSHRIQDSHEGADALIDMQT